MRVYQLAKELGITPAQLRAELQAMGEYVSSSHSVVPAPVERDLRRRFPAAATCSSKSDQLFALDEGDGAEFSRDRLDDDSLEAAIARARRRHPAVAPALSVEKLLWKGDPPTPVVEALLREICLPDRHVHTVDVPGRYYAAEMARAKEFAFAWVNEQLNGFPANDREVVAWIRATRGRQPAVARQLYAGGVSAAEASLPLWYGKIRTGDKTLVDRVLDGTLSVSEAISQIRAWRQVQLQAG